MKLALSYFMGMATASGFWAAAMWGEDVQRSGLWALPVFLSVFSLAAAAWIALGEKDKS